MTDKGWPRERVERLEELWEEGVSVARIAQKFGKHPSSVTRKARQMGLPERGLEATERKDAWSKTQVEVLRREWARGTAGKRIAEMTGKDLDAVKKKREALGLEPRFQEKVNKIPVKAYLSEEDVRKVGARAASAGMTVSRWVKNLIFREIRN